MEENRRNIGSRGSSSSLWIGLILIGGGAIVLLNRLDILPSALNWWALFILLPAFGFLSGAYNRFRANNAFSMEVMFPALIGLFMVALSLSMLVGAFWNIDWSLFWPLILILIGLGLIFGRSRNA